MLTDVSVCIGKMLNAEYILSHITIKIFYDKSIRIITLNSVQAKIYNLEIFLHKNKRNGIKIIYCITSHGRILPT